MSDTNGRGPEGIAIVGMAARFPGARDVDEFWSNIIGGVDSISHFTNAELEPCRLESPGIRSRENYVKARGIVKDADKFDAAFFGIPPREAAMMDPQHRLFLEGAWAALESAGYDPAVYPGSIGVWGGTGANTYFLENVFPRRDLVVTEQIAASPALLVNERDYLTTRVSYKLNLRGPSVNVSTACSTSLVAVCQAVQAVLSYECDIALAGGVFINSPQRRGYLHQEGAIGSPDGACRPFDAAASGTVFSDGIGIVVLKRLADALADNDTIYAVIKGAAINNDGSGRVSFTAPSVDGQAEVIARAQALAGVDPETISYVEAHGTATPLGDPIEIAGLTQAFRSGTGAKGFCAIGSVKSNIGHVDAAAGVAGLIKTVLALHHRMLPASLHFTTPNPKIDFAETPFYVNTQTRPWPQGSSPRRAGVSSFGVGGTNAHVVLEEAPARQETQRSRPEQLLILSAKTEAALDQASSNLARRLQDHPEMDFADVAYTLQAGRREFAFRRAVVARDADDAAAALESIDVRRVFTGCSRHSGATVAFLFPGQGAPRAGMTRGLYQREPLFRSELQTCAEAFLPHLGFDIRSLIFAGLDAQEAADRRLAETSITQPVLFSVEYALARLWMAWGVVPAAMIGHSVGEYVAACLAGVMSLNDAVALVAARGRVMQLDGALEPFRLAFQNVRLASPQLPWISCVTGNWITPEQAVDPEYWLQQLRRPVRFSDGIRLLGENANQVLLEVGAGNTLGGLVRQHRDRPSLQPVVTSLGADGERDMTALLEAAGRLWISGVKIDWNSLHGDDMPRRVSLPTYPFERQRHWIDPLPVEGPVEGPEVAFVSASPDPATEPDVLQRLRTLLSAVSGIPAVEIDMSCSFLELGFDSLLLTQVSRALEKSFKIQISFRELIEKFPTPNVLGAHLEKHLGVSPAGAAPLSDAQREIWAAVQMGPEASCSYNLCFALRLAGAVSVEALQLSIQHLFDRHEALRMTFSPSGEWQTPGAPHPIDIPLVDLSGLSNAQRDAALKAIYTDEVATPLDLMNGSPARVKIIQETEDRILLVLTAHHIVFDGWSAWIFFQELATLYAAARNGGIPSLDPAEPFSQFVLREVRDHGRELDQAYWRARFENGAPVLDLPLDAPRPPIKTYVGAMESIELNAVLSRNIRHAAGKQGSTVVGFLFAAFQALLSRLTGQSDVVIGLPVSVRDVSDRRTLIGHATNMLPVRIQCNGEAPLSAHLQIVKDALLDAQEHQSLSFGSLVRRLNLPRDPSRTPMVAATFNLDRGRIPPKFVDAEAEIFMPPRRHLNFEIEINVCDTGREFIVECSYNTDLLTAATIRRWLSHYVRMLTAAVFEPETSLDRLPLLTDAQFAVRWAWNATKAEYSEACVHELISAQTQRTPERVAAEFEGSTLTYSELDRKATALARRLAARGVRSGVRVGVFMERSLDLLVGVLGVLKAGGAYVPLDPAFPTERLAYMLSDSAAAVVLTNGELHQLHRKFVLPSVTVMRIEDDEPGPIDADFTAAGRACPDDLAYLIYTSGSTGRPKGVAIAHRSLVNLLESMGREPGLTEKDVLLSVTTLSFDIAALELYLPLIKGARVVLASREEALDGDRLIKRLASGVTVMQATPATWRLLLDSGWKGSRGLKVLCGGEALSRDLADNLLRCAGEVWNMYGPTETTVWSSAWRVETGAGPISIGNPIANTQMWVLDAHMKPVPLGLPGELYIGGVGLALGYWQRPELTAQWFLPDPFSRDAKSRLYRTGDLARWLPDGRLECLGRIDHQVKVRGFRVELGEIEVGIARHPAVRNVVVVVREDASGEKQLVAYVVAENRTAELTDQLRELMRIGLPAYMAPSAFVFLERLPLTPNGKIDRKALPAPSVKDAPVRTRPVAARTRAEEIVVRVFREILNRTDFGVRDNFFDLGGHSLMAARLMTKLRAESGADLPLRNLFEYPTAEGLARVIDGLSWLTKANATGVRNGDREEIEL